MGDHRLDVSSGWHALEIDMSVSGSTVADGQLLTL